jgi:hypothetical protein
MTREYKYVIVRFKLNCLEIIHQNFGHIIPKYACQGVLILKINADVRKDQFNLLLLYENKFIILSLSAPICVFYVLSGTFISHFHVKRYKTGIKRSAKSSKLWCESALVIFWVLPIAQRGANEHAPLLLSALHKHK